MRTWLLLALVACVEPLPELPTDSASVSGLQSVRARLMAPETALFRQVRLSADSAVCGEVAAMNAAQEYVGWRQFRVVAGRAFIAKADPDSLLSGCR
jgi:hypothetical protein